MYQQLSSLYWLTISGRDLYLTAPDAEGKKHLIISQSAQAIITADAAQRTSMEMKDANDIQTLPRGDTNFKTEYRTILESELGRKIPGSRVQTLNTNGSGTTIFRTEGPWGS